ncbi:hypothetical protein Tco_1011310 [Tanacetum coccineum]
MEILLEPTSNKLLVDVLVMRTRKSSESNATPLEDLILGAGNPVKEVLLNRTYLITGICDGVTTSFQQSQDSRPHAQSTKDKYMMKAQTHVSKYSAISDVQALPQKNIFDKIARY